MKQQYQWKTVRAAAWGGALEVHGFKEYDSGVLKGQMGKFFLDSYDSLGEAVKAHPEVMQDGEVRYGSKWTDPQINLNHLPDEDTPAAGGMYPDDYDDDGDDGDYDD